MKIQKIKKSKRGQMTIFVILAIAIVGAIILFFLLRDNANPLIEERISEDPSIYIGSCTKRHVNDIVDIILPQGGFSDGGNRKMFNGINVTYLCYNSGNYLPCINEHPVLLSEIKKEIKKYIEPRIDECFLNYKKEIENRNGIVELGEMKIDLELIKDRIFVYIERKINMEIKDQTYEFNDYEIEIINPIYNIARVAMEIASQEAKYCYFEYVGYMVLYPRFNIERFALPDSSEIYSIIDKQSGKKMNIAVRSCAIPPGL